MNNTKILILEDNTFVRQALSIALRALDYDQVVTAGSFEEALIKLRKYHYFDVLICDIRMQGQDGLQFIRTAKEHGTINALMISSEIEPDLRQAAQQLASLAGYQVLGDLRKPFSGDDLKNLMLKYYPPTPAANSAENDFSPTAAEISTALQRKEITTFFQPKVCLKSMKVIGAEALSRWRHPTAGLITPSSFIPQVEKSGQLNNLTLINIRNSLNLLKEMSEYELQISINLEACQLSAPSLHKTIQKELVHAQIPASKLTFEITETGLMQAPIESIENLIRIRLLGCKISIDDFGTGYSSFKRMCDLPCNELKLDASFTRGLTTNPRVYHAVDHAIRLSESLNIVVVAEGIETFEQARELSRLNCHVGQGFLFSRPLSSGAFSEAIKAKQIEKVVETIRCDLETKKSQYL